ncbi:hypothetical protein K5M76_06490 [Shewanella xiamenensis]|uniref:hypothetical protein n=1 Tax=Shewanella xiamenensis TaxID=332186 RepID=UPI00217EDDA1|nr:hypothetical protein [Shewanella xiamenensis]MCT8858324.1 hypothetical protein [Shewanella xiamenensis]UWG65870.1 hypothetical protein K5M76_06490 [Shewanella xiamenensis]
MSHQITSVMVPQFDLSNPQHLAMRKLMADVYARYFNAVDRGLPQSANVYRGMGAGLERVAVHVLNDAQLGAVCSAMNNALNASHLMRSFA